MKANQNTLNDSGEGLSRSPNQSNETRARFACNCGGDTRVQSDTLVLHDCKAQPGCKVFDYPRGFVRWIRVQINPQLTGGAERYNWFIDWQSSATSD